MDPAEAQMQTSTDGQAGAMLYTSYAILQMAGGNNFNLYYNGCK